MENEQNMPQKRVNGKFYAQGVIYTGRKKIKHHWIDDSCSIHIKVNGDNTEIVYTKNEGD